MKLLLHICCAPCSISIVESLRKDEIDVTGFWYNPNVHPYTEYRNRLETLKQYSQMIQLPVIYNEDYGLRAFTKSVINNLDNRCSTCYLMRLEATAKYAKENGFEAFSTTLLISPYQQHDLIKTVGEKLAKAYDIKFYYQDFRTLFRQGQDKARKKELYMQKYCGCIFSEEERYSK